MTQAVIALLAAPFIGLLVAVPVVAAAFGDFSSWSLDFGLGLFLAYPAALMVGVPLYLGIKHLLPVLKLCHAVAVGGVSSVPLLLARLYPFDGLYFERAWPINAALAIAVGMTSGAAFWLIMWKPRSDPASQRTASPPGEF